MSGGITATLVAAGMDAALAATVAGTAITGAEIGGAVGFGTDLIEGKSIGNSLLGGLEGGAIGGVTGGATAGVGGAFGGEVGSFLGTSPEVGGSVAGGLAGAGLGAGAGALTGQNPLVGAAVGGAGGAASGYNANATGAPISGASTGGAGGATAAPAGVGGAPGGDVTLPSDTTGNFPGQAGPQSSNFSSSVGSALSPSDSGGLNSVSSGAGTQARGLDAGTPNAVGGSSNISGGGGNISGGSSSIAGGGNISGAGGGTPSGGATTGSFNPVSGQAGAAPSAFSTAVKDPSLSNIGKALGSNAGLLTAGAGLANDVSTALAGPIPGTDQIKSNADLLQQLGQQNTGYLNSGTLPTGLQSGINQATKSAIAAIKSKYASMGMSGSSAEQTDIANVQQQAATQGAEMAMQLMNSGVSELGLSSELYNNLIKNTMASDQGFASAFTNLATAAGGGGSPLPAGYRTGA